MDRSEFWQQIHKCMQTSKSQLLISFSYKKGVKVFREVCPKVSEIITIHLTENNLSADQIKRMWLHQANINMIDLILRTVVGKDADKSIAPVVIAEYGNTSSASPVVAFHETQDGVESEDLCVMCSFGAGYSIDRYYLKKYKIIINY